jgi:hypothetical protein
MAGSLEAKTKRPTKPANAADPGYVSALATANRFLHAWQSEDHEAGLLLVSDDAKQRTSEERFEKFFQPGSNVQRAFQIGPGTKVRTGRYSFPVKLYERIAGASLVRTSQLLVVNSGGDEWVVDRLP